MNDSYLTLVFAEISAVTVSRPSYAYYCFDVDAPEPPLCSKWQTMKWTILSGMCEPIGAAAFGLLLKPFLSEAVVKAMLAAGAFPVNNTMLHMEDYLLYFKVESS
jgi:hypothetical protein